MPAYICQVAVREGPIWTKTFVSASNRYEALDKFINEFPGFDLERIADADEVEVEQCV